jgi:hypothetical protein
MLKSKTASRKGQRRPFTRLKRGKQMKKVTFSEVVEKFRKYNVENNVVYGESSNVKPLTAVIVYKESSFDANYSLEARSYRIASDDGKLFFNMPSGSRSFWGDALDGTDPRVRLDFYSDWEIDYCYFEQ